MTKMFRRVFILLVIGGAAGVGLAAYKKQYDIEHDLSVIGQGIPTIVQVHDPKCQLCQRLRSNSHDALVHIKQPLLYRIADITTLEGRRIQRQHQVPHVTLLLYDGSGEVRNIVQGVKPEEELIRIFKSHLKRWGKAVDAS
ncbi:MAG: hypothetical protein AAF353_03095 [Pseudomonadota bacterium]